MRTAASEQARRVAGCRNVQGRAHHFVPRFRIGDWSQCQTCGVTQTAADWAARERHIALKNRQMKEKKQRALRPV